LAKVAVTWLWSRVLGHQVPLTDIRGSEQFIGAGGTPNRCRETYSPAIPQAFVPPSHWCHRRSPDFRRKCPCVFLSFAALFFLVPIASFQQRNFAPGSLRNDGRQLGRPTASPTWLCAFLSPKVDRCRQCELENPQVRKWDKRRCNIRTSRNVAALREPGECKWC
jgi:hypothetical protein